MAEPNETVRIVTVVAIDKLFHGRGQVMRATFPGGVAALCLRHASLAIVLTCVLPCGAAEPGYHPQAPYAGPGQVCPPGSFGPLPSYRPPFGWPPSPQLYAPPQWADQQPIWPPSSMTPRSDDDPKSLDAEEDEAPRPSPYGDPGQSRSPFDNSSAFNNNSSAFNNASSGNSSSQLGSASSSGNSSVAPNMIGDLFGMNQPGLIGVFDFDPVLFEEFGGEYFIPGGNLGAAPGAAIGRQKFSENGNPIPHDRFWVDYSYFDNARLFPGNVDVHRGVVGFEKTFMSGFSSLEVRVPFAETLSSGLIGDFFTSLPERATALGNLTLFGKALLTVSDRYAFAVGLGLTIPTAGDVTISDPAQAGFFNTLFLFVDPLRAPVSGELVTVKNQSFHLLPYIGGTFTPFDRIFINWNMQLDVDINGNEANIYGPLTESRDVREVYDANYFFLDVSLGYWIFRRPDYGQYGNAHLIDGMAALFEVHHNVTIMTPGVVEGDFGPTSFYFTTPLDDVSVTNLTFGLTTLIGKHSTLTTALISPVDGNEQFDREFRLIYDFRF